MDKYIGFDIDSKANCLTKNWFAERYKSAVFFASDPSTLGEGVQRQKILGYSN